MVLSLHACSTPHDDDKLRSDTTYNIETKGLRRCVFLTPAYTMPPESQTSTAQHTAQHSLAETQLRFIAKPGDPPPST